MPKILFIGDIVAKPGRKILAQVLPEWKEKYKPDVVVINVENLAHGKGVTPSTLAEINVLGIDAFTSGNHIFDKNGLSEQSFEKYNKLIRPANFEGNYPGFGYYRFAKEIQPSSVPTSVGTPSPVRGEGNNEGAMQQYLVLNLNGQVFMENQFEGEISNPFLVADRILTEQAQKGDIIIVDFHSEATSEKEALGFYLDGRVAAVLGTHTHVATADSRVLEKGTAYISDVGMTGSRDSILGVKKENVLDKFLHPETKFKNEPEEKGVLMINGVLIEVGEDKKAIKIEKLYKEI